MATPVPTRRFQDQFRIATEAHKKQQEPCRAKETSGKKKKELVPAAERDHTSGQTTL